MPDAAGSRPRSTKSAPCGVPRDAGYHMQSEYSRSALRTMYLPTYRPLAYLRCAPSESLPLSACQRLRSSASAFLPTECRASPYAACDTYIGHGKDEPIARQAKPRDTAGDYRTPHFQPKPFNIPDKEGTTSSVPAAGDWEW